MSDSSEEGNVCAICWDEFSKPKILPCRHTFCKPCLKGYLKKTENCTEIKCPMCRQTHQLDADGLDGLLDNYFVNLRPPDQPELLCCNVCFEEGILKTCSHCSEKHCPSCRQSHKLALKISGESYEHSSDSESEDLELDDRDITDEPSMPFHMLFSGQTVKTQFNAKLVSAFKTKSMHNVAEQDGNPPIYKIFPRRNNRFLVILNIGPEMIEYEPDGTEIRRFNGRISDIIETTNHRTFFVHPADQFVLEIINTGAVQMYVACEGVRPICLAPFKDGRLAVAGLLIPRKEKDEDKEEEEEIRKGILIIYDKNGKVIREISDGTDGPILRFPTCISINHLDNSICVADQDSRCVTILNENGDLLRRYDAGQSIRQFHFLWNHTQFIPLSLCHDPDGNIIAANNTDGVLHVLHPDGRFLGYVLTKDSEGFGHPAGIMMDDQNRIWLGDRVDGKIRIYEISSFKNHFDQRAYVPYYP